MTESVSAVEESGTRASQKGPRAPRRPLRVPILNWVAASIVGQADMRGAA